MGKRDTIINVIVNDKEVDSSIVKLQKMGEVDEKNAKQFKKNNDMVQKERVKTLGILEKARIKEQQIFKARERSNNPKAIARYNKLLDNQRTKIRQITGETNKQVAQMNMLQGAIMNIGAVMLASFSVQGIIQFASELKKLSIQMDADAKKNAVVFGDSLKYVTEEAQRNAHAIGLTTNEYVRASASTQDLLVPLGFAREEASKMSTNLTDLSGALSVWSGGTRTATEVSEILTKTILGETEQIKTLGIKIDQTSPAFNKRIKQMMATNDLSLEQAKAMEILNQIMTKSADAQESFATGTKTLAQSEAEVNAQLREQKETLAQSLRPLWLNMNKEMNTFITNTSAGLKELRTEFDLWWRGIVVGAEALGIMESEVTKNEKAIKRQANSMEDLSNAMMGNSGVNQSVEEFAEKTKASSNSIAGMMENITKLKNEWQVVDKGSERFKVLKNEIRLAEKELKKLMGGDANGQKKTEEETLLGKMTKEAGKLKKELQEQTLSGIINNETMRQYLDLVKQLELAQNNLSIAIRDSKIARGDVTAKAIFGLELLAEVDTETTDVVMDNEEKRTEKKKEEAKKRLEIERKESQAVLNSAMNTVNALQQTFSMYTQSRLTQLDNLVESEIITEEEGAKRKNDALRKQATVDKLFRTFGIITKTAEAVTGALALLPNPAAIPLSVFAGAVGLAQLGIVASTPLPAFKDGTKGKVGDGMARVGEEGEEFVFLPHGSKVLPNAQTKKYADIIDAMYDNKLDSWIMQNYVPNMLPAKATPSQQNDDFINKMIFGLGKEDFNSDAVVDTLKNLDKREDKRLNILVSSINKVVSKRNNLRRG